MNGQIKEINISEISEDMFEDVFTGLMFLNGIEDVSKQEELKLEIHMALAALKGKYPFTYSDLLEKDTEYLFKMLGVFRKKFTLKKKLAFLASNK